MLAKSGGAQSLVALHVSVAIVGGWSIIFKIVMSLVSTLYLAQFDDHLFLLSIQHVSRCIVLALIPENLLDQTGSFLVFLIVIGKRPRSDIAVLLFVITVPFGTQLGILSERSQRDLFAIDNPLYVLIQLQVLVQTFLEKFNLELFFQLLLFLGHR